MSHLCLGKERTCEWERKQKKLIRTCTKFKNLFDHFELVPIGIFILDSAETAFVSCGNGEFVIKWGEKWVWKRFERLIEIFELSMELKKKNIFDKII